MNRKILVLTVSMIIGILSCNSKNEHGPLTIIEKGGNTTLVLDYRSVVDTITLKLSEIVEDVRFIRLETNDESLLGIPGLGAGFLNRGTVYIGEKNILVLDFHNGLFQFSIDGTFIRIIAPMGRGPGEIGYPICALNETGNGVLYISDPTHPNSIISIDMTTGEYLRDIPRALTGFLENIMVINDTVILCAPTARREGAGEYFLFSQTTDGIFLSGIKPTGEINTISSEDDLLYNVAGEIFFRPVKGDTIFSLKDQEIHPALIVKTGNEQYHKGNTKMPGTIEVSIDAETEFYTLIGATEITNVENVGRRITSSGRQPVFIDKVNNKSYIINYIKNDFFPESLSSGGPNYGNIYPGILTIAPENQLFYIYEANKFKRIADMIRDNDDLKIDPSIREQILTIGSQLKTFDNPVIMLVKAKSFRKY